MTSYPGRPAQWDGCYVHFDVPGWGSGRIFTPALDKPTALATFHSQWPDIAKLAIARYERGDLENGEAVLDIRTV
jgi:hypothetical protein